MTDDDLLALRDTADGALMFHSGLWGAPMGFMWATPDGSGSGHIPQWEHDALERLHRRHLVVVQPGHGPKDGTVSITETGRGYLDRGTDQRAA